jgi:hypothetical protein
MRVLPVFLTLKERENTLLKIDILIGDKNLPVFKPELSGRRSS